MPAWGRLGSLPKEILVSIFALLSDQKYVQLRITSRAIREFLEGNYCAGQFVLSNIPFSKEGQSARENKDGYFKAILRRLAFEKRISKGLPHSTSILAVADNFVYDDGNLCYVNNDLGQVRLLNVHEASGLEHVLDFDKIFNVLESKPNPEHTDVIPMAYNHGILALRFESDTMSHAILLLVLVDRTMENGKDKRVLGEKTLPLRARHFVKIIPSYLWYGSVFFKDGTQTGEIYGMHLGTGVSTKLTSCKRGSLLHVGLYDGNLCVVKREEDNGLSYHGYLYAPHKKNHLNELEWLEPHPDARRIEFGEWCKEDGRRFSIHADETTGEPVLLVSRFLECNHERTERIMHPVCHLFTIHSGHDQLSPKFEFVFKLNGREESLPDI